MAWKIKGDTYFQRYKVRTLKNENYERKDNTSRTGPGDLSWKYQKLPKERKYWEKRGIIKEMTCENFCKLKKEFPSFRVDWKENLCIRTENLKFLNSKDKETILTLSSRASYSQWKKKPTDTGHLISNTRWITRSD